MATEHAMAAKEEAARDRITAVAQSIGERFGIDYGAPEWTREDRFRGILEQEHNATFLERLLARMDGVPADGRTTARANGEDAAEANVSDREANERLAAEGRRIVAADAKRRQEQAAMITEPKPGATQTPHNPTDIPTGEPLGDTPEQAVLRIAKERKAEAQARLDAAQAEVERATQAHKDATEAAAKQEADAKSAAGSTPEPKNGTQTAKESAARKAAEQKQAAEDDAAKKQADADAAKAAAKQGQK